VATAYSKSVFINCPFSPDYLPLFRSIVFCVIDCGFIPRCALELIDSSEIRLQKIERIIGECKFGVHDLSNMELDESTKLPRFNMPLELGIFLGAKRFGIDHQKEKRALIMDRDRYRYMAAISDISGQDIECHNSDTADCIKCVRNWLQSVSRRKRIASGTHIATRFRQYERDLPPICAELKLDPADLQFNDLVETMTEWLKANS